MKYTNVKPAMANISKEQLLKPFEAFKTVYNSEIAKQHQLKANASNYSQAYLESELAAIKSTIVESYVTAADTALSVYDAALEAAKNSRGTIDNTKPTGNTEQEILRQLTMLNTRQELQDQFATATDLESFAAVIDQFSDDAFAMTLIQRELDKRANNIESAAASIQYQSIARELKAVEVPQDVYALADGIRIQKAFKTYNLPTATGEFKELEIEYTGVRER